MPSAPALDNFTCKKGHKASFLLPTSFAIPPKALAEGAAQDELLAGTVKLLARTKEAIDIYGELVVHDFDAIAAIPTVTPTDYCHNPFEILGHADKWAIEKEGLITTANLLSVNKGDRAHEVLTRMGVSTPYQSSIQFVGDIYYYHDGKVVVNGKDYDAPIWVWRNWTVLAVAICPLGRDPMTKAELLPLELCEKILGQKPPVAPTAAATDSLSVTKEQIKRFHARFGPLASDYLSKEYTYEQAIDAHSAELEKQFAATKLELEETKKQLAAKPKSSLFSRGQTEPISSGVKSGGSQSASGEPRKSSDPLAACYSNPRFQFKPKSSSN